MGVTLTGHIDVPPHRLEEVRDALAEHIRLTRAEPGCLAFDVTEDPDHPGRFAVAERFVDAAAFAAHQARAGASDWARITDGIARHYTVTGMDP
ncbi:MAG: antibiotic biosynthesis monooxygenase [Marinibacterium sp.]|nr:antibiotic biosynthesis monooxygenase [Marinibacterium sp.]